MTETIVLPGFGDIDVARIIAFDDLFAVIQDKYPVSPGHTLIVVRRLASRFQELTSIEKTRLLTWIDWTQQHLARNLSPAPDAFNFGLNDGPAAGQTIVQLHFHVIPRYAGDVPDPRGGVRQVIPSKARYWAPEASSADAITDCDRPSASNSLSLRAKKCLTAAGIPIEKEAVLHALRTGALYPFDRPPLYGKKTHQEVCRWAGLSGSFLPPRPSPDAMPLAGENGLSYRANRCLIRAGIPAEKSAVVHALNIGVLQPGKRPLSYGRQTHLEICRWAGVDVQGLRRKS
jgi:diadenosine tetraphosphate (Ap4A) HIT family hydrolase